MKKLGLLIMVAFLGTVLIGCSSDSIPSDYAGIKIGDAVAKRLTNGKPAIEEALDAVDLYAKNETTENSKTATKKVSAMLNVFHNNTLADNTETFDELTNELLEDQDGVAMGDGATPEELKGAISTITAAFVTEALPSAYQSSYKDPGRSAVIKQYLKDFNLKPTKYWIDNVLD